MSTKLLDTLPSDMVELIRAYDREWSPQSDHESIVAQVPVEQRAELSEYLRSIDREKSQQRFLLGNRRFEIHGLAGKGGVGEVYHCKQRQPERDVAIKILSGSHTLDPESLGRFRRESRMVGGISHPHIIEVFEVGEKEGIPYLVMEWMPGGSLADWLQAGPLAPRFAARIVRDIAQAVGFSHEQRILHRDLKPANVLMSRARRELDEEGRPPDTIIAKLSDFGLAKNVRDDLSLTREGFPMGTPAYMSPEQSRGQVPTERTDVYGLGAILFSALTSRRPFESPDLPALLQDVIEREPESPRKLNAKIPIDLERVCLKCLAKQPKDRYPSAADLVADLNRFLVGDAVQARTLQWWQRALRFARREPYLVTAVSLFIVSLVVFSAITLQQKLLADQRGQKLAAQNATLEQLYTNLEDVNGRLEYSNARLTNAVSNEIHARGLAEQRRQTQEQVRHFLETLFASTDPIAIDDLGARYGGQAVSNLSAFDLLNQGERLLVTNEGITGSLRAELLVSLGVAYRNLGSPLEAVPLLEEAIEFHDSSSEIDTLPRAHALTVLGMVQQDLGNLAEAIELFEKADEIYRVLLADAEAAVSNDIRLRRAGLWLRLGWAHSEQRTDEAEMQVAVGYLNRCIATREQELGPDHRQSKLARAALMVHEMGFVRDPVEFASLLPSNTQVGRAIAAYALAEYYRGKNQVEAADKQYLRAIELTTNQLGPEHPVLLMLKGSYAGFLRKFGHTDEALVVISECIRIGKRVVGIHPLLVHAIYERGLELARRGQLDLAKRDLDEALRIALRVKGPCKPSVEEIRQKLDELTSVE